jgi:hypothetical protein
MVLTEHQIYRALMGIETRLAELDKHTATGLASLDANLKLHQQETRHYRYGILSRLDAVEATLETYRKSAPGASSMSGLIAFLVSPSMLRVLFAAGMLATGYSLSEVGEVINGP